MKHLKNIKNFKDLYHKIDNGEYYRYITTWRSKELESSITDVEISKLKDMGMVIDYNYPYEVGFIKFGKKISIRKNNDDWFIVSLERNVKNMTNSDLQNRKFYCCDQFDGLIKLIDDIIKTNGKMKL